MRLRTRGVVYAQRALAPLASHIVSKPPAAAAAALARSVSAEKSCSAMALLTYATASLTLRRLAARGSRLKRENAGRGGAEAADDPDLQGWEADR
jgi:hypothetical protein